MSAPLCVRSLPTGSTTENAKIEPRHEHRLYNCFAVPHAKKKASAKTLKFFLSEINI
nr:MAG TPA: hypothetical protein [Caudoviricetes sp.]